MSGEVTDYMSGTRRRLLVLLAGVTLLVVGGVFVAIAVARPGTGGVPPSQTRNGNVTVDRQTSSIRGTIRGNLTVLNHATVTLTGHVTGWLHAYGTSSVTIGRAARVDGGVLQSTGTLEVQPGAWVGTGLDTYTLSRQMDLGGDLAGQARISASGLMLGPQAHVAGDLSVWASPAQVVRVDGTVDGSVRVSGTDLHLGPTSHIGGSTSVYSGKVTHG